MQTFALAALDQWNLLITGSCVCFLQGGFEYKRAIVDCIISIIEENPESKETGLAHLCEFIEDCEHTVLATKILHLLGKEGPRTPSPSKYIRFIFNRVVLESEAVRAGEPSSDFQPQKTGYSSIFKYNSTHSLTHSLDLFSTISMSSCSDYIRLKCIEFLGMKRRKIILIYN